MSISLASSVFALMIESILYGYLACGQRGRDCGSMLCGESATLGDFFLCTAISAVFLTGWL